VPNPCSLCPEERLAEIATVLAAAFLRVRVAPR